MVSQFSESLMHGAAEGGDFLGVEGEGFLSPAVGDGFQKRDQGGGGGEDDSVIDAALDEAGIGMEGGGKEGFTGEEEDGELRAVLELFGVFFRRKLLDVGADLGSVLGEKTLALGVVSGFEGVEVGIHGRLGIDDDGFSAGEFHDEIGAEAFSLIGGGGGLEGKIAVLLHSGELDDSAKLHFPPMTAADGLAESFDEGGGFPLEAELAFAESADLFFQLRIRAFAEFFDLPNAQLEFPEGVGDGFN